MRRFLPLLVALPLVGCSGNDTPPPKVAAPPPKAAPKPWRVVGVDPASATPALLWNGLVGVRIGRSGAGVDENGAALPLFLIDSYETSGEERIVPLDNPLAVVWDVDGHTTRKGPLTNYKQELDYRTGELRTSYILDLPNNDIFVKCSTYIHPTKRQIAQRWEVGMDRQANVTLTTSVASRGGARPEVAGNEFETTHRLDEAGTLATVRQALRTRSEGVWGSVPGGFAWKGEGRAFGGLTLDRTVSLGRSATWPKVREAQGVEMKLKPGWNKPERPLTVEEIRLASQQAWEERWKTDIEIDGPVEDQQAVRSFLFYLRSAVHPDGEMSISPMGLSNQQYNGHVFWDADMWVFPALAFIDPMAAKEIADYRLARENAANGYYMETMWKDKPLNGAVFGTRYPWESSVSGRETAPHSHRNEIHISGDVAWMLDQAVQLGLAPDADSRRIRAAASNFYLDWAQGDHGRIKHTPLDLKNVMSPNENHIGDNDLYTNLLAQWCLDRTLGEIAKGGGRSAAEIERAKYKLPKDEKSFLTYDDDPVRGYKQAAAVLAIYPLQYPEAEKQAKVMMDRFGDKVTENGPAMSDSLHALIWARLGEDDKAYETWRASWQEFTNHPLLLFSEKRRKEVTYFTTGAAGCLQTVIYGFLGFRVDVKQEPGAVWSKRLLRGRWLSIKPNLPKAWKSVKFKNFKVLGKTYTLTVTHQGARVTEGDK
jgi:trehalose/maltose hydrolase-like predicted phosphorylase